MEIAEAAPTSLKISQSNKGFSSF